MATSTFIKVLDDIRDIRAQAVADVDDFKGKIPTTRYITTALDDVVHAVARLDEIDRLLWSLEKITPGDTKSPAVEDRLVLVRMLREVSEAQAALATTTRTASRTESEGRTAALREAFRSVYYALYDDIRD